MIEEDRTTLWCGNLPEQATEELLYELFLQAGPLERVRIGKDKDGRQKSYAFITYCHEVSVPYAYHLFQGTALFHKKLMLQFRGRPMQLPPPIRCNGPEPTTDFEVQNNVTQKFVDMTEKMKEEDYAPIHSVRQNQDHNDKLVMASLQGNWTHRHHPYRPHKDNNLYKRDGYRSRDNYGDNYKGNNHNKHTNNWRDRRNHQKGGYHRRD
ncbi:RNA-binding protein 7 [Galleria mellonella]|uniref:RNA-binding protein 7 n=1 Tax=Galleria mellonella TaxID=7137 RepID=A0A6J1WKP6_GALME|nr:RNA-binding protein 7 [Galleria mellonella]